MAKVTLSFEIDDVNEDDTWEIEEVIKGILNCGAESWNYIISKIQFIEFETNPYEEEDGDEE
jgi:hypothetical protein